MRAIGYEKPFPIVAQHYAELKFIKETSSAVFSIKIAKNNIKVSFTFLLYHLRDAFVLSSVLMC